MSKARGGRPSKLTPEVREKIVTAIREGNYAQVAAVYPDDWRAAMSYLERKHPKRWGRRVDVTSGDEPLKPIPVEIHTADEAREALRRMGVQTAV